MSEIPSDELQPRTTNDESAAKRAARFARSAAFRYYIHDSIAACRLELIGELTETEVGELTGCWRTARTILGSRSLILDLRALKSVDEAGKQWLAGMAQEGAVYSPESYLRDLVAGKHMTGSGTPTPTMKPGLVSRVMAIFRGLPVEAAK